MFSTEGSIPSPSAMWDDQQLLEAVSCAASITGVFRELGVVKSPARLRRLRADLDRLAPPMDHFRDRRKFKITDDQLMRLVPISSSYSDVIRRLGRKAGSGGRFMNLKRRIIDLGLDTGHFKGKGCWGRTGGSPVKKHPDEILVRQEKHAHKTRSSMLRRALVEAGEPYKCSGCGSDPEWLGKPLNLQVHHKNGDNLDHRRKNLEFLCPNCHSQTPNYGNRG